MSLVRRLRNDPGFTLIELLVVVLIIGILIAVSAPSFLSQTQKAHDSEAKQYLATAYKEAVAAAVDNQPQGDFVTSSFDAASLAAAIQASEPQLQVQAGSCPSSADGNPKHIFIDSAFTTAANLELCNDPTHRVWFLKVQDHVLQPFSYEDVDGSSGGVLNDSSTPPPNDDFANAIALSGPSGSAPIVDNTAATFEASEPQPSAGGGYMTQTVWYKWTVPAGGGDFYFNTDGSLDTNPNSDNLNYSSRLDTIMGIYSQTGSGLAGLQEVTSNDEEPGFGLYSQTQLTGVNGGDVYYIQVGSSNYGDPGQPEGSVHLNWAAGEAPTPPAETSQPTITDQNGHDPPQIGDQLTVSHDNFSGSSLSYTYQWVRCADICANIDGATSANYTIQVADSGFQLFALVTASNDLSPAGVTAQSGSTAKVVGPPTLENAPTVADHSSGLYPSATLDSTTGQWASADPSLSYSYQWYRCDSSGAACSAISSDTAAQHSMSAADADHTLRVEVTASNQYGASAAARSAASILWQVPIQLTAPTLSGTATVGASVTVTNDTFSGSPDMSTSYSWLSCDSGGNSCVALAGSSVTLIIPTSAQGHTLRAVVTATDGVGSLQYTTAQTAVVTSGGSYVTAVGSDSPDGYWRFNESSGSTAYPYSGPNGSYGSGVSLGQSGATSDGDTAASFDGSVSSKADFGNVFNFTGHQSFSLEAWIKPSQASPCCTDYEIFGKRGSAAGQGDWALFLYDNGISFYRSGDLSTQHSANISNSITANSWSYVVATYDGSTGTMSVYVNGALQATTTDTDAMNASSGDFQIGFDFPGLIDEPAVYSSVLSCGTTTVGQSCTASSQIGTHYAAR